MALRDVWAHKALTSKGRVDPSKVIIEMPRAEAKRYLKALQDADDYVAVQGTKLKPRWQHLMAELTEVLA